MIQDKPANERALIRLESIAGSVRVLQSGKVTGIVAGELINDIYDELLRIEFDVSEAFCPLVDIVHASA